MSDISIPVQSCDFYQEPPVKKCRSHDRESPLPLKNLGNTCYENSIVQCLFGLDVFMSNFERSMARMRESYVKKEEAESTTETTTSKLAPDTETATAPSTNNATAPETTDTSTNTADAALKSTDEEKSENNEPIPQSVSIRPESDVRYRIADAFDKLYKTYTTNPNEQSEIEARLEDLKSAVGERSSQFNSTHQQDASEFFYHVIDSIQEFYESLDKTKEDDNPVTKAFELELDHLIRCPKCHHRILSGPEKIRTLPLATEPQPDYTLSDALTNYFKDDILDCSCSQPNCDSKQRTKRSLIRKLPQVLFITLARYSYTGKKNLDEIEAPFELSVPFHENMSPSHSSVSSEASKKNEDGTKYHLAAVVCHLGSSLNVGHYTSYVYNQKNGSWYSCDDDSISKVEESEVKSDASKSGYCFFYVHSSCIKIIKEKPLTDPVFALNQVTSSVAQSSVVMTPESSPESSPPPSDLLIK